MKEFWSSKKQKFVVRLAGDLFKLLTVAAFASAVFLKREFSQGLKIGITIGLLSLLIISIGLFSREEER